MVRIRTKICDRCQVESDTMYRVRVDRSRQWQFVCGDCWQLVSSHPDYVYGGTWKAHKK